MISNTDDKELKEKVEYLIKSIDERIEGFEKRRKSNRKYAIIFQSAILFLSVLSTIFLGLDVDQNSPIKPHTKNIALMLSSLIAFISGFITFFDYKELWINYTNTKTNLYNLQFEIEFYLKGNNKLDISEIRKYKDKYQEVLTEANKGWSSTRKG